MEKRLKKYREICRAIEAVKVAVKKKPLTDTVKGSEKEFPYLAHTMKVSGIPDTEKSRSLLTRLRKLEAQKAEIEKFVWGIEDELTRVIFEMRFLNGYSWAKVAYLTNNTPDAVRMRCERYLRRKKAEG